MTIIDDPRPASLMAEPFNWAVPGTGPTPPGALLVVSEDLRPLVEDLESLLALPDDWDSYGGRPTTVTAARTVVSALEQVRWRGPLPTVSPMSDGGVTLEWGGDTDGVELSVSRDGVLSVLIDVDGAMHEHTVISGSFDATLLNALRLASKLA
ncbi:MAG: hypothetical protein M3063_06840 [Actinomycetota bacterium]|nr:hypothetical protein [Actinomycetota bacterium]